MERQVVIERDNLFNGRGSLRAFRWLYSLRYVGFQGPTRPVPGREPHVVTFSGMGLQSIRNMAKRIARENDASVREGWAK